ncbi:hypothetical protein Pfo_008121 [Paulownia fortunei]|nr:hypothetical protein Pfo_008121 [Paulownia fortunei]
MTKMIAIKNIDKLLKDVMKNNEDFGGKVVVFCEDFRQVLIVVPKVTIYQTIFASLVKSYLLHKMKRKIIKEHESMNDPNFSEFLLRIGKSEKLNDTKGNIKILKNMIIEVSLSLVENEVYPFQFRRGQFYMKLYFVIVMTIKKAQCQTILNIGVYLPNSVSSKCQLYIAISRGTSISIINN